uniref:Ankyrin repeat protein n=1 Tax=viral metagenome TaxID=1070528 RepID=A0A6C0JUA0_9ZZZZ
MFTRFVIACERGDIINVRANAVRVTQKDRMYGLFCACYYQKIEIVKFLLDYVENIDISTFELAIELAEHNLPDVLQLLFNSGKLDDTMVNNATDFKENAMSLLDEYKFRLDGKIYNENILT